MLHPLVGAGEIRICWQRAAQREIGVLLKGGFDVFCEPVQLEMEKRGNNTNNATGGLNDNIHVFN